MYKSGQKWKLTINMVNAVMNNRLNGFKCCTIRPL